MYTKILAASALAASLAFSQITFADSSKCGERLSSMVSSLNLDSAQKEKIKPIIDKLEMTMKEQWSQMKDIRTKMKEQVESENMDQAVVDSIADQKAKIVSETTKAKIAAKHEIFTLLKPEQKIKLKSEMEQLEEKMAAKYKSCHEEG